MDEKNDMSLLVKFDDACRGYDLNGCDDGTNIICETCVQLTYYLFMSYRIQ